MSFEIVSISLICLKQTFNPYWKVISGLLGYKLRTRMNVRMHARAHSNSVSFVTFRNVLSRLCNAFVTFFQCCVSQLYLEMRGMATEL